MDILTPAQQRISDDEILEQRRLARQEKSRRDAALLRLHEKAVDAMAGTEAQQVRERALSSVNVWQEQALCSLHYIIEWRRILNLPPQALRQAVLRNDAEGIALRQNSPFEFLMGNP